jgi:hypothetical protein
VFLSRVLFELKFELCFANLEFWLEGDEMSWLSSVVVGIVRGIVKTADIQAISNFQEKCGTPIDHFWTALFSIGTQTGPSHHLKLRGFLPSECSNFWMAVRWLLLSGAPVEDAATGLENVIRLAVVVQAGGGGGVTVGCND